MSERTRRDKQAKLEKLAEYKRAREGGGRLKKDDEDVGLYDEVTEEQYRRIVGARLQRDDFVEDDGVGGYADNGIEDWDGADEDDDMSSEEEAPKKKSAKGAKSKPKPPPKPKATMAAYRPVISAEQETDFMASLLGDLDSVPAAAPPKARKRKPSPSSYRSPRSYADTSSDPPMDPSSDDYAFSPQKKARMSEGEMTPATERFSALDVQSGSEDFDISTFNDIDMESFDDLDDDPMLVDEKPVVKEAPKKEVKKEEVKKEEPAAAPAWLAIYDTLTVNAPDDPLVASTSAHSSSSSISALEPDGSLRFFWLEYLENDGKLYLVGKLKDKVTNAWVSCCVTIEGMERNVFMLPRTKQDEFGEIPTLSDLLSGAEMLRKKTGISAWKSKFVKRKYAFGESDVPREETQWLKVVYGFNEPPLPMTDADPTPSIARIFGTNTSAFELFVLKRKIMGPCWLEVKNPKIENKSFSWCKLEVTAETPKDVSPFASSDANAPQEMPPLTVMSLSVRTIVNHQENEREVVCVTARTWTNMLIDDPRPPEKIPCTSQTFVRPLEQFPAKFEAQAKATPAEGITAMKNERVLLNGLMTALYRADPDIIVGHDFLGISLDVLLKRMKALKVDHWSRIGRFRRSRWPSIGKQGTNLRFLAGRLLCDLASDGAKSMISSTTWSLTEMCKTHLELERQDIDPDSTADYFDPAVGSPDKLFTFVRHCGMDSHYYMAIASKVQIIALTKQLTNLAGNSWNKTLNGGRAERNEYILLHEFHKLKYICPDKMWGKKVRPEPVVEADDEDGGRGGKASNKKKRDKYKGGLVFEPKRGLWDKYILVMDFNSLYPSIIQEFNIDFTTVEVEEQFTEDGEEKIPDPPEGLDQGVLPRLIASLVERRRLVKGMMKNRSTPMAKLKEMDIRQQALKLTANSMYGCLGFEYSRFYARPLAALTTFKGREILTQTRALAESMGLDVVYGDTDSVFVNTNVTELDQAMKISSTFKRAVNEQYRLLEIDLDGIFKRLLLLQKKKYAALKVDDGTKTSTEVKGLDMKRREYCNLSKDTSQYVLEQILSGAPADDVLQNIHDYLTELGQKVREGKVSLDKFLIFKRLGKNPEDYPDVKSQPHVQVALRMKARGGTAKLGDVIPYLFCLAEGEQTAKTAQADRARHPEEFRKPDSGLKIDLEYYLGHQVLPPIERLCDPIEGTDRTLLAQCLGLDPQRYRTSTTSASEEQHFLSLDARITDSERFKDADPFVVRCRSCKTETEFAPAYEPERTLLQPTGPTCSSCSKPISTGSIQTQLETQVRAHINRYYEGWVVCTDVSCGHRTRRMGVWGRRCLQPNCLGKVAFEYSDAQLYNQLGYYKSLFSEDKAMKMAVGSASAERVNALVSTNLPFLQTMTGCLEPYLDSSARRWIELKELFSFMNIQP
ncbi:DNA polymerase [Mycena chlorophos]|uniref:DNA polymerase n=1 Tax=Mycena chlorophos TaxID=658473 RepID=A0A8H6VRL6_MYCCL|nr:DNA polymerase [Mycena chlorophos]